VLRVLQVQDVTVQLPTKTQGLGGIDSSWDICIDHSVIYWDVRKISGAGVCKPQPSNSRLSRYLPPSVVKRCGPLDR